MENDKHIISRRAFLNGITFLGFSGCLFKLPDPTVNNQEQQIGLWNEFSLEEKEIIENSEMAKIFLKLDYHKLSCAELTFLSILKYIKQPKEYVYAAAGFGGGLGHEDLCGMITGGIMGLGVVSKIYLNDPKESEEYIEYARDDYWSWWISKAPLRCEELKKRYDGDTDFLRMGQRATAKLDELIQVIKM